MRFQFTETQEAFRKEVVSFLEAEKAADDTPWKSFELIGPSSIEFSRKLAEKNWIGINWPKQYGGRELSYVDKCILSEEMSRFQAPIGYHFLGERQVGPALIKFGTDWQKEFFLPRITAAEEKSSFCLLFSEPDAGSDLAGMKMRAVPEGEEWVLNGTKMFITNGVHGDLFFVAAKTDTEAPGSRGITMFIVERGTPGFSVGRALNKTGWLSSDTAELVFDGVRVPEGNVVGEVNRGFYCLVDNLQNERLTIGGMAIGECQKALALTLDYVKQRKAFGGSLWDRETVRQRMAQLYAEVEAARHLVYHCAWLDSRGEDCVKETSMVKVLCGELVNKVTYECVQFHGGAGYMRETAVERMSRDARVQAIGGGATEVMREEIAKRL